MSRLRLATISGGIGAVALAAGLTWGVVGAQEPEASTPQARLGRFIERFAQHLGVTTDEAESALKATQLDYVNEAEAAGKLTPEQAARLREHIDEGAQLGLPFAFGGLQAPGGPFGGHLEEFDGDAFAFRFLHRLGGLGEAVEFGTQELASALGLTTDELRAQLRDGASLAELVEASGKTPEQVTDDVLDAARVKLDEHVAAGDLTREQANAILERARPHVLALLSGDVPLLVPGFRGVPAVPGLAPADLEGLERRFEFHFKRSGLEGAGTPSLRGVALY
jgi:hypothetical protein